MIRPFPLMKKMLITIFIVKAIPAFSQNTFLTNTDSLHLNDSIQIQELSSKLLELTQQIQEMKLNEIVLQNERDSNGKNDSILKVKQKLQIDSLRLTTRGAPLVIEEDTLFTIYARIGGMKPEERVEKATMSILTLGKSLTMTHDSIYTYFSDFSTDIMAGERLIINITDQDALWQNTTRDELALEYLSIIEHKVTFLHDKYGLENKVKSILMALAVIVGQGLVIYLTNKICQKFRTCTIKFARKKFKPISVKGFEILNVKQEKKISISLVNILKYILILFQLFFSLSLLFSIFPETESIAYLILSYIWIPAKDIIMSFFRFIPNFLKIVLIYFVFKYIIKGLKYIINEIANGRFTINGFYADWAYPTYTILRFLLYSFMIIMIWPLLPGSSSPIFQGVSVFLGLIFSLGSTSVIGNLVAGFVITYMRPFRIGDQIKLNDVVGKVIEKTPFVIRVLTPKKETITIPNSFILSSHTTNYSATAKDTGIIIYPTVTVGYDIMPKRVEELLIKAAMETEGVLKKPAPFVLVKELADFYCCYQVNAYTRRVEAIPMMYSLLQRNIIETFNAAGIEIMSPHFYAKHDEENIIIPNEYKDRTPDT